MKPQDVVGDACGFLVVVIAVILLNAFKDMDVSMDDVPYVLQYNKRDLPNVAPTNYLEFVLNNRKKRVQSFEVVSSSGQNVFASLNAVSQILLHKFSKQSDTPKAAAKPVAVPMESSLRAKQGASV